MDHLLALTIGGTPIEAPATIPTGGLPEAYGIGSDIILLAYVVAIILALAFLIWGGIKWITSEGDKTKVQGARNTLLYSIIGLVIIFLSFFIINILTTIFDVPSVTGIPSTSPSSGNSHEGQWGCFDNKDDSSLPPGCFMYSPTNDPAVPRAWYGDNYNRCVSACH